MTQRRKPEIVATNGNTYEVRGSYLVETNRLDAPGPLRKISLSYLGELLRTRTWYPTIEVSCYLGPAFPEYWVVVTYNKTATTIGCIRFKGPNAAKLRRAALKQERP